LPEIGMALLSAVKVGNPEGGAVPVEPLVH
jgi:hypothetical protein